MSTIEVLEMDRCKAIDKDVASLLDKYLWAVEWDVPEADEARAWQMVLNELREAQPA